MLIYQISSVTFSILQNAANSRLGAVNSRKNGLLEARVISMVLFGRMSGDRGVWTIALSAHMRSEAIWCKAVAPRTGSQFPKHHKVLVEPSGDTFSISENSVEILFLSAIVCTGSLAVSSFISFLCVQNS